MYVDLHVQYRSSDPLPLVSCVQSGKFLLYTFFQVNACFQKMTAEILGIKLSRPELELQQRVVKAEIVPHSQTEKAATSRTTSQNNQKSGFCVIQ